MRLCAYVLAADPTWIEHSIPAYYPLVDRIVVSYDQESKGWTGQATAVEESLEKIRAVDPDGKCEYVPGIWRADDPMMGEVAQRQHAIGLLTDADWVLQLDTDEVLTAPDELLPVLESCQGTAVDWPSRTLYRRLSGGWFLEIVDRFYRRHVEFPGPLAIRPDATFTYGRRPEEGIVQAEGVTPLVHNSWARDEETTVRKVTTWGHASAEMVAYVDRVWKPATRRWPLMRNFHPLYGSLWPRLRPVRTSSLGVPGLQ